MPIRKVIDYLRKPEVQTRIMTETQRRPIVPQVKPSAAFGNVLLVELPFPDRLEIVDRILFAYLDQHRRPSAMSASSCRPFRASRHSISSLAGRAP